MERAGCSPEQTEHILRWWLRGGRIAEVPDRPGFGFSKTTRAGLGALDRQFEGFADVIEEHPSPDGAVRLLARLPDGAVVESVLLPGEGLCVSTQVGCAVGCTFCMTGKEGLERSLLPAEMLAQLVLARRRQPVRRVVFMGMGEPAHNLPAVIEAIDLMGRYAGVGHKELVFSTVGHPGVFERLAGQEVRPALALSLHTTDPALRQRLLPRAPSVNPAELLRAAVDYSRQTGHPLQVQWTLLAGVNDGDEEVERLIELLRGARAVVNFIPYNPVDGLNHRRTSGDRAIEMTRALHRAGIVAKLRTSHGGEVDGACGQLRGRILKV